MDYVVEVGDLPIMPVGPHGSRARILHGARHAFTGVSLMLGELQPGEGPALHRHAYDEAFVIAEGTASFTIDGSEIEAGVGEVVIIPAGVPHAFINAGTGLLRVTAIHAAPEMAIEWLEAPWRPGSPT